VKKGTYLKLFIAILISLICNTIATAHSNWSKVWQSRPFYFGLAYGWGCTDWSQLVAKYGKPSEYFVLAVSAPISAGDRGSVFGVYTGYEISPHFSVEINYMKFPNSPVVFDPIISIYTFEDGVVTMSSSTYVYNLLGKFMVQIAHTGLRGFATAGPALIHRHDALVNTGHIDPTFGVGLNYVVLNRLMIEIAFQYYAGFGKAVLRPAINYIPFLYTVHLKLAYRL